MGISLDYEITKNAHKLLEFLRKKVTEDYVADYLARLEEIYAGQVDVAVVPVL